ncbi:MAG: response regulator [Planctomycetota bacterium]|jgi:signal transduction histidine kinase|nr:response regulator [Planctomycetota bacterium]
MITDSPSTHVVIIEDDPIYRTLLNRCLSKQSVERKLDVSIHCFGMLADGLRHLDEFSADVLLLDLTLPDSSGINTYHSLLAKHPHLATIILTADDDEALAAEAIRSGAQDFLFKNYTEPVRLLRVIMHAIERQRALDEVVDAGRQAERAQRMIALGTMASGIAHEYNNLNAVIMGNLELATRTELSPSLQRSLDRCVEAVRRSTEITRGLLDFARDSQAAFTRIDIRNAVDTTLQMAHNELEEAGVSLVKHGFDRSHEVDGNPEQLGQILLNLIINACHAMRGREQRQLSITLTHDHDGVALAIADTGCGMTESHRARIFDPFFSTKSPLHNRNPGSKYGTGLGLSICDTMARHHRGSITAQSIPGEGSTFTLRLPSTLSGHAANTGGPQTAIETQLHGRSILVVDDELRIAEMVEAFLSKWQCSVTIAESGEAALDAVAASLPDLILTDWSMPGMGGAGLVCQLGSKRRTAIVPVVVMTGLAERIDLQSTGHPLITGVLRKPFAGRNLRVAIEAALAAIPA